jgi:hypothetical protein
LELLHFGMGTKSGDLAQPLDLSNKFMWSKLDYIHLNPLY